MAKKTVTETLREAVRRSIKSRYRIAKESGLSESVISRFMDGAGISSDSLDRLAETLGLRLR